jgi:hypothetical protein
MSEEALVVSAVIIGWPVIFLAALLLLAPSPMQQCIKAGYEWRGGDCVMGVTRD